MAYNLAPYNLTAYNSGSDSGIFITVFYQETVTYSIGTSLEAYLLAKGYEQVLTSGVNGGNGIYLTASGTENIEEAVTMGESSVILGKASIEETITGEATINCEAYPNVIGTETIEEETALGSDIYPTGSGTETITGEAVTDKETYLIAAGYELISASATLEAVDIIVCEINTTLEPGDRLVVDAENYNVLLNNENLIWAQSGAWIDEMTRETSSISVTAASGVANLSANILYTERYL